MKVVRTEYFNTWFDALRDPVAKIAIATRISRIEAEDFFGKFERYGNVSEFRFFIGPGYRVYFTIKTNCVVLLLLGGDKASQKQDFKLAEKLAMMPLEMD